MSDGDPRVRALLALREADRFLCLCRTTHARELEEARLERHKPQILGGVGLAIELARGRRDPDEDAVVAVQELGEAVRLIQQASALLPDCDDMSAVLAADRRRVGGVRFIDRVDELQIAVRTRFARLRGGDPALAAAVPPLVDWKADEEDKELARAAGAGMSRDKLIVGGSAILYLLYSQIAGC